MKQFFLAFVLLIPFYAFTQQRDNRSQPRQQKASSELTIPAIFSEAGLIGRAPETVKWSPDGTRVSYILRDDAGGRGDLYWVDVATGKPAVLVASEKLATLLPSTEQIKDERERERRTRYSVAGYHWSPDSKHLLFDAQGQLWFYSLQGGVATQVTSAPEPSGDPKFSPDGQRLAYLRKHDLYVRSVSGNASEIRLTEGKAGTPGAHARVNEERSSAKSRDDILNGEVDWLYAEELDVRSNYFWSPDGKQIAYVQMDESKVPTYPIEDFMPTRATVDQQKYPRPGDPIPAVRLGVVDSTGGKTQWISLPNVDSEKADFYIPRFGWVRSGLLYVQVLNRVQNKNDLYFVEVPSGRSRLMLTETSPTWISKKDIFKLVSSRNLFVWPSWRDGNTHLYLYSYDATNPLSTSAKLERQLTKGPFETFGIEGFDDKSDTVYFTSAEGDARQHHLYAVKLSGGEARRISREPGTHAGSFPDNAGAYYVDNYSATLTPPQLSLCKTDGTCSVFWQSRSLSSFGIFKPQFVDFKADDGTTLHGWLLLPPAGTVRAGAKVPLIVHIYGGPANQLARDAWGGPNFLFHEMLATRGFAIFMVDNRGTPGRGRDFIGAMRHNFGEVELKDQNVALDQLLQKFPQLDRDRIGIWGWSNGGYMTLYALTHAARFKAGVSVAPVTDWRDYDATYTERYMGLLPDNADGYRRSSPANFAQDLHGRLFLAHGTSDDNVHMQNTVQMVDALINAGKQFDLMLYPNKTHGIAGASAKTHLFTRIQWHFEKYLMNAESDGGPPKQ